ncbi:hypothetical protein D187_007660 [Cystobacter fuscus DSM 2262]|uniref:Uncharacterized protein n=1 Tax=Cystobacter fuscus (strain ATCC 25194 / DSM 2262 / NBRC 100088 / M29) TaxID=1242864 RepID=S9QIL7_CYSF2|nr:hypothetical protein D187_007660 [Cystobacter fuscus DSM 2262]
MYRRSLPKGAVLYAALRVNLTTLSAEAGTGARLAPVRGAEEVSKNSLRYLPLPESYLRVV